LDEAAAFSFWAANPSFKDLFSTAPSMVYVVGKRVFQSPQEPKTTVQKSANREKEKAVCLQIRILLWARPTKRV
jgi:hypothetical protein